MTSNTVHSYFDKNCHIVVYVLAKVGILLSV